MRYLSILAISLLVSLSGFAQIHMYPVATGEMCARNGAAADVLRTRMKSAINNAGLVGSDVEGRFVLAGKVDLLQKEVTPTAPQQHVLNLQVTYTVGDGYKGTAFGSTTIEVKGVGPSEEKAFMNALKNLKANNRDLLALCQDAQGRIRNYYEQNGASILSKAKTLIASNKFDEACAELYAIPEECSYYNAATDLMGKAITAHSNHNSAQIVAEAEAMWAGNPTPENGEAVMAMLSGVETSSPAYAKAQALKAKVEKRILNKEAQDRADQIAADKRDHELNKLRITENGKTRRAVANAAARVASAYYRSHRVTYHIHRW